MYQVNLYKKALKSLKKLPLEDQARLKNAFQKLKFDPFSLDIKKLNSPHTTSHRIRIGSYRIFLDIEAKIVTIVDIERRTTQTYHK